MTPYFDPATAESEEDHYLNVASDIVGRLAPVPTPETNDYIDRRSRAERAVMEYLLATKGAILTAKGGIPSATGSKTFADWEKVREIVRTSMGSYFTAGKMRIRRMERA